MCLSGIRLRPRRTRMMRNVGFVTARRLAMVSVMGVLAAACGDDDKKKSDGGKLDSAVVLDGGKTDVVGPGQPDLGADSVVADVPLSDGPAPDGPNQDVSIVDGQAVDAGPDGGRSAV